MYLLSRTIRPCAARLFVAALIAGASIASAQNGPQQFKMHAKVGKRIQLTGSAQAAAPAVSVSDGSDPCQSAAQTQKIPPVQRWNLITKPRRSRTVLDSYSSPTLSFLPDQPGLYVAQGEVTSGVPPRVTIAVGPSKTLTPIQTQVPGPTGSGRFDLVLEGQTYAGTTVPTGINVLLLRRDTLEPADDTLPPGRMSYSGSLIQVKNYLQQNVLQQTQSPGVIVILYNAAQGVGDDMATLAPELEQLGATQAFRDIHNTDFGFSFIGSKGLKPGQAFQVGSGSASLHGYFALDTSSVLYPTSTHNNYTFMQPDYVTFALTPSKDLSNPSKIQIGDQPEIQSQPPAGAVGGFLLVVVASDTLETRFTRSYATLGSTPDQSISEEQALMQQLALYQGDPGTLVFLTSFGSPHNGSAPVAVDFTKLAQQMASQGGTYDAIYPLNIGDTYSLVSTAPSDRQSGPSAVEAGSLSNSSTSSDKTGVLQGVLQRRRQGNYYAPIGGGGAGLNLGLYNVLARQPSAWPVPQPNNQAQQDAYSLINQKICGSDADCIRNSYNKKDAMAGRLTEISNLNDDDSMFKCVLEGNRPPFNQMSANCQVMTQLYDEVDYATHISAFNDVLNGMFAANTGLCSLVFNDVPANVNQALQRSVQNKEAESILENVLGTVLSIGSAVGGDAAAPAFGLMGAALSFGTNLANTLDGNSNVTDINVQAAGLAKQAALGFVQQDMARGIMFDSIYEDWGKLQQLGIPLRDGGLTDPTSPWHWEDGTGDDTTTSQVLKGMVLGAEISLYRSLLPVGFVLRVWNAQDPKDQHPGDYKYDDFGPTSIFRSWKDQNYLAAPSSRVQNGEFELDLVMLTKAGDIRGDGGSNPFDPSYIQLVPDTILQSIFGTDAGDLGVWKPEFYRRWPFQKFYCNAPGQGLDPTRNNPNFSDCDSSTPQLPQ